MLIALAGAEFSSQSSHRGAHPRQLTNRVGTTYLTPVWLWGGSEYPLASLGICTQLVYIMPISIFYIIIIIIVAAVAVVVIWVLYACEYSLYTICLQYPQITEEGIDLDPLGLELSTHGCKPPWWFWESDRYSAVNCWVTSPTLSFKAWGRAILFQLKTGPYRLGKNSCSC